MKVAAVRGLVDGNLQITQVGGKYGVCAEIPGQGEVFVALSNADRAYPEKSDDPNDHIFAWVKGKDGRMVQVHLDQRSGHIVNWDEVNENILDVGPEVDGGIPIAASERAEDYGFPLARTVGGGWLGLDVDLSTGVITNYEKVAPYLDAKVQDADVVDLSGYPPLGPDEHWITLKPHGPESEDYVHVIVRKTKDGGGRIVWAGHKGLMNLRLNKLGSKDKIEEAEKRKPKALTPEERAIEAENRQKRQEALVQNDQTFATKLSGLLGVGDTVTPEQVLGAVDTKQVKQPVERKELTEEEKAEAEAKRKAMIEKIAAGGDPEDGPGGEGAAPMSDELAETMLAEITDKLPQVNKSVAPDELKAAWKEAAKDPEKVAAINALFNERKRNASKIKRELRGSNQIKVLNQMGWYENPGEMELNLMKDAREKAYKDLHSKFWGRVEGLKSGARIYFQEGQKDALAHAYGRAGLHGGLDSATVHLFGAETIAAAIAASVKQMGPKQVKHVLDTLEDDISDRTLPTVSEALARSEELRTEREMVARENLAGNISNAAAGLALTNLTIEDYKHLARAGGSLDGAAAVAAFLRRNDDNGANIDAGDKRDEIVKRMQRVGMVEGTHFHLNQGGIIHVPQEHLGMMMKSIQANTKLNNELALIKSHALVPSDPNDFEIPGFKAPPGWKWKPSQIATIQMFEKTGKILGNLGVGLGKTSTFGAMAARLFADGKAKRAFYILPAGLTGQASRDIQGMFPGMKVSVATGNISPEKREEIYRDQSPNHLILISQDTLRSDGYAKNQDEFHTTRLGKIMADPELRPGAIFGDEVHAMFTPGADADREKQSMRSSVLHEVKAPYMAVMTGTPFRQSFAEVHKILDYLNPGSVGSMPSWMARYGRIGQGTSAFDATQEAQLQQQIDPMSITERETQKTEHRHHHEFVDPSEDQWKAYRREERLHAERVESGKHTARKSAAMKVQNQLNIMASGHPDTNPIIQRMKQIVDTHAEEGRRGVIHATNYSAVRAAVAAMPKGELLPVTGEVSLKDRRFIMAALNKGLPYEGVRMTSDDGFDGVVTSVKYSGDKDSELPISATLESADGKKRTFKTSELTSKLKAIVGTSVISTGLNLQEGGSFNIHLQPSDSAAIEEQKNARTARTGQKRDVDSYYLNANTPQGRRRARRTGEQHRTMATIDDPREYDDPNFIEQAKADIKARGINSLAEKELHGDQNYLGAMREARQAVVEPPTDLPMNLSEWVELSESETKHHNTHDLSKKPWEHGPLRLWHAGEYRIHKFEQRAQGTSQGRSGKNGAHWLTTDREGVGHYGHIVHAVDAEIHNPMIVTPEMREKDKVGLGEWVGRAKDLGHDSLIHADIHDGGAAGHTFAVFDPSKLKVRGVVDTTRRAGHRPDPPMPKAYKAEKK